jgi:hypothetical protein
VAGPSGHRSRCGHEEPSCATALAFRGGGYDPAGHLYDIAQFPNDVSERRCAARNCDLGVVVFDPALILTFFLALLWTRWGAQS